jgi:hypothetical protein
LWRKRDREEAGISSSDKVSAAISSETTEEHATEKNGHWDTPADPRKLEQSIPNYGNIEKYREACRAQLSTCVDTELFAA